MSNNAKTPERTSTSGGFTFQGLGLVGFLTLASPVMVAALVNAIHWHKTSFSNTLLDLMPVSVDKMPVFTVMWVITMWLLTQFTYLLGVVTYRPAGVDNLNPRAMAKETTIGWAYRLHCAHDNTTEFLAIYIATIWVATTAQSLDPVLIAKWSSLVTASRTLYPLFYLLNWDVARTASFAVGFFTCFCMGWTAVFPETLLLA